MATAINNAGLVGDRSESYEPVAIEGPNRRMMLVGVSYGGVLPEGAFPPETNFYRVTVAEIRARCVSAIEGIDEPFQTQNYTTIEALEYDLISRGVSEAIREQIFEVIARDGNAPKCDRVRVDEKNQIFVYVTHADPDPRNVRRQLESSKHSHHANQEIGGVGW
ncbi:hypothetical protein KJ652_04150 [Patescibacteria group bacterium]|nr:hypothetical protein [Patescibacteria group bacterium]